MKISNPKIGLIGYGSMGKEIQKQAEKNNYEITGIYDIDNKLDYNKQYDFDIAIEFSFPEAVEENVKILAEAGKNIVVGTTGWYDKKDEFKKIAEHNNI